MPYRIFNGRKTTRWGQIARRLARSPIGVTFWVAVPRGVDAFTYARQIRNGLNGHSCCTLVRRSVRAEESRVAVTKVGYWPSFYA